MFLSIFEIFKIGVGPSSSHTMGPMVAAARFLDRILELGLKPASVGASLHGSLAFTGKGHQSDFATIMGLAGMAPDNFNAERAQEIMVDIEKNKQIQPVGHPVYHFDANADVRFDYDNTLPGHANGMTFFAYDALGGVILEEIYYSIGGGFVQTAIELNAGAETTGYQASVPYPFKSANEMLAMARDSGKTIAQMKYANETVETPAAELDKGIKRIWQVMNDCIDAGLATDGILPGGLNVRRRAKDIHTSLLAEHGQNFAAPHIINDWISMYAMAVNEQNAMGAQVVTAPTNGAAGVIPSTLRYYLDHVPNASVDKIPEFLLTAAAVGGLIKHNASISGAEVGCQGEVGSASAMAAAGLCALLGGTPEQIENAAEIALEHHLGMTCDPIKGLVQAPCIERNGLGAIKAVSAASLSMRGDGKHLVSLDACIETMRQTGMDMNEKYKETSLGGLAVNLPAC
ncbi:L-serine ammonia-lyase [Amylibacter kogurei]|uniref:L-serine dehydratase n=1 Tax=Paramylibacter kogurei TaxID=1889778 RepID=A0A2G5K644_9RHOB|nr:L-serine ammonia-lyase [Amylibacter kogurei]PIB24483.1 L-serine ammonia-lyase [Amylibacter kogurei]